MTTCRICATCEVHPTFVFREKMFGWGDAFEYFQCARCGCMQIATVPADLGRFYPTHYYSFHLQPLPQHGWKAKVAAARDRALLLGRGNVLKRLLSPAHPDVIGLGRLPLRPGMRILDLGCGRGQLLSALYRAGFRDMLGADPFVAADHEAVPGVRVLKKDVTELDGHFDLIMMHHVLEHIEAQVETLDACREHLAPEGHVLVRIPVIDCEAWERYGENWVALDAPRHLFLHTRRSLDLLAGRVGLRIARTWSDSTAFQFAGSELYRNAIALVDTEGCPIPLAEHFNAEQLKAFNEEAEVLNATDRGDQIVALLAPISPGSQRSAK